MEDQNEQKRLRNHVAQTPVICEPVALMAVGRLTLHLPERLNNDLLVDRVLLAGYEEALVDICGGFTMTRGTGAWRSARGEIYCEPVRVYAIDGALDGDTVGRLSVLAQRIATELDQEAVYLTAERLHQAWLVKGVSEVATARPSHTTRVQTGNGHVGRSA